MMPPATTAIRVRGLSKRFGGRLILSGVDLDVATGECVALTGANGAGKTTLLGCLASVVRPTAGRVQWFGQPAGSRPALRRWIGVVAHESCLYPHLTLRENLLFAARMCGVGDAARRADRLIEAAGLTTHAHRVPGQVSRGVRRRLAAVRALIHDPKIILLDEPFSGLDERANRWLLRQLENLRAAGRAVCLATHDREISERLADRILRVESGRLREIGPGENTAPVEDNAPRRAA